MSTGSDLKTYDIIFWEGEIPRQFEIYDISKVYDGVDDNERIILHYTNRKVITVICSFNAFQTLPTAVNTCKLKLKEHYIVLSMKDSLYDYICNPDISAEHFKIIAYIRTLKLQGLDKHPDINKMILRFYDIISGRSPLKTAMTKENLEVIYKRIYELSMQYMFSMQYIKGNQDLKQIFSINNQSAEYVAEQKLKFNIIDKAINTRMDKNKANYEGTYAILPPKNNNPSESSSPPSTIPKSISLVPPPTISSKDEVQDAIHVVSTEVSSSNSNGTNGTNNNTNVIANGNNDYNNQIVDEESLWDNDTPQLDYVCYVNTAIVNHNITELTKTFTKDYITEIIGFESGFHKFNEDE